MRVNHHADAGGIYLRADDLSAFSLDSFLFDSHSSENNPHAGQPDSYWEVLGFGTALNPELTTWNWAADPTFGGKRVAYQKIPNGTNEIVPLNDEFKNIKAFWIHYVGITKTPSPAPDFELNIGDVQLSAPVAPEPPKLCP